MAILKRNSSGSEVVRWQKFLVSKGYKVDTDGKFGPATEQATQRFQLANNLIADGIVGENSLKVAALLVDPKPAVPVTSTKGTILLSAGHTNNPKDDRGAVGNGFIEGVEAVRVRDALASALRQSGRTVIEDGADGVSDPLRKAIALAKTASTAIEFHFNAGPPTATGIEVLSKPKHKDLAQKLARAISDATNFSLRGPELGWRPDSSGQHHRLGFCEAGGLIVEIAFISNKHDMAQYVANFDALINNLADVLN